MDTNPASHRRSGSPSSGQSSRSATRAARTAPRLTHRYCDIRLTLPARAENVAVVRQVVGTVAEAISLPPMTVEDVRLAVTEACTNVVRHAYVGSDGPLLVAIVPDGDALTVVVSDHGRGLQPNPGGDGPGLGLPLMAALTSTLEIEHAPEAGTRLRMSFRPGAGTLETA